MFIFVSLNTFGMKTLFSIVFAFRLKWALCSWGHVTTIFQKIFYIMGYNLKNTRNGKKHIKNTKMAKFEVPSIKE